MDDPVRNVIRAGIVGVCFSHPAVGAKLSGLELRQGVDTYRAFEIDGSALVYNREHVKALTFAGLRDALLAIAENMS
ncbi:hypothetical protein [Rhizobium rhizogenes]|uniref:hypothetical protein n=1 Tax=Rhizobium rhizogenes TaxID=359 RepID=UPI0006473299|nr:hypothetical protein [Rhizobium rhizogenes]